MTTALGRTRLLALARHLLSRRRGHREFNFADLSSVAEGTPLADCATACGTAGCAMGELPYCFPRLWAFQPRGYDARVDAFVRPVYRKPRLRRSLKRTPDNDWLNDWATDVEQFFHIGAEACGHLFYGGRQVTEVYGGRELGSDATPAQVASNIRAFVRREAAKRRPASGVTAVKAGRRRARAKQPVVLVR